MVKNYNFKTASDEYKAFPIYEKQVLNLNEALQEKNLAKAESIVQSSTDFQNFLQDSWFLFAEHKQNAIKEKDYESIKWFLKYDCDLTFDIFTVFEFNFETVTEDLITFLAQNHCELVQDLLMIAIKEDNEEIVKALLDSGVNLDNISIKGETLVSPLNEALNMNNANMYKILSDCGIKYFQSANDDQSASELVVFDEKGCDITPEDVEII